MSEVIQSSEARSLTSLPRKSAAVVLRDFGGGDQLLVEQIDMPSISSEDILVRVEATSINPIEWKMRQGLGLPRWLWRRVLGEPMVLGMDFSGSVVAIGSKVEDYGVGDDVMGAVPLRGAYSEYLVVRPGDRRTAIRRMPSNVGYDAAAVLPFAGLVAFAGLVSQGGLALHSPGARIMVIGASGGVGHLAVQMAKHGMQASFVVAVSSTRNAEFVRSCGADYVVPYDRVGVEDLVSGSPEWVGTFDLIFDCVGIDSYYTEVSKHLLKPGGRFVSAALPHHKDGRPGEDTALLGGLALLLRLLWRRAGGRYRMIGGLIGGLPSKLGFPVMVNWLAEGKVLPRITSRYSLSQIADAHRESEGGRTVGKIVIEVGRPAL